MSDWQKAAKAGALKDGVPASVELGGKRICLVRRGSDVYAITDMCTHAESLLSVGEVEDMEIVCPLHGARFDLKTGEALTLPAVRPVATHDVKIDGEDVLVRIS